MHEELKDLGGIFADLPENIAELPPDMQLDIFLDTASRNPTLQSKIDNASYEELMSLFDKFVMSNQKPKAVQAQPYVPEDELYAYLEDLNLIDKKPDVKSIKHKLIQQVPVAECKDFQQDISEADKKYATERLEYITSQEIHDEPLSYIWINSNFRDKNFQKYIRAWILCLDSDFNEPIRYLDELQELIDVDNEYLKANNHRTIFANLPEAEICKGEVELCEGEVEIEPGLDDIKSSETTSLELIPDDTELAIEDPSELIKKLMSHGTQDNSDTAEGYFDDSEDDESEVVDESEDTEDESYYDSDDEEELEEESEDAEDESYYDSEDDEELEDESDDNEEGYFEDSDDEEEPEDMPDDEEEGYFEDSDDEEEPEDEFFDDSDDEEDPEDGSEDMSDEEPDEEEGYFDDSDDDSDDEEEFFDDSDDDDDLEDEPDDISDKVSDDEEGYFDDSDDEEELEEESNDSDDFFYDSDDDDEDLESDEDLDAQANQAYLDLYDDEEEYSDDSDDVDDTEAEALEAYLDLAGDTEDDLEEFLDDWQDTLSDDDIYSDSEDDYSDSHENSYRELEDILSQPANVSGKSKNEETADALLDIYNRIYSAPAAFKKVFGSIFWC